ncbi:MAG: hypothetical protein HC905_03795, partial [Bacteroidales bacterium]|nr:hypothetical protein [Bacteroidales bacterium]
MNIKQLLLAIGIFFNIFHHVCLAQGILSGTVVEQKYVSLVVQNIPVNSSVDTFVIKRMEFGRYLIPYSNNQKFIKNCDPDKAAIIFKGTLKPDSMGYLTYNDQQVKQKYSYVYWLQNKHGKILGNPVCLKLRDPKVWMSQQSIEKTMDSLVAKYPKWAQKTTFGKTVNNLPINGLVVGNLKNALLLVGYTHAGESGAELHLATIAQLLKNNKKYFRKAGIIVIPVLNIDSRNLLINGQPDYVRTNANGVDLNRNFPANWEKPDNSYGIKTDDPNSTTYRGPFPASEPETQTLMSVMETYKPTVFFDYHWMGTITGCNLLSYLDDTVMKLELELYGKLFHDGFFFRPKKLNHHFASKTAQNQVPPSDMPLQWQKYLHF